MKELPRVYVNPIEKEFDNYQKDYDITKTRKKVSSKNLSMKIKEIFNSSNYIYKRNVLITTDNDISEKVIVGKTRDYLLTLSGEKIRLIDIIDIEII